MNFNTLTLIYNDLEILKTKHENIDLENLVNHLIEILEERDYILKENEDLQNRITNITNKNIDLETNIINEIKRRRKLEQVININFFKINS